MGYFSFVRSMSVKIEKVAVKWKVNDVRLSLEICSPS